jgi:hypothetical protein
MYGTLAHVELILSHFQGYYLPIVPLSITIVPGSDDSLLPEGRVSAVLASPNSAPATTEPATMLLLIGQAGVRRLTISACNHLFLSEVPS